MDVTGHSVDPAAREFFLFFWLTDNGPKCEMKKQEKRVKFSFSRPFTKTTVTACDLGHKIIENRHIIIIPEPANWPLSLD